MFDLPVRYYDLEWQDRRAVRQQYVREQRGKCFYCGESLGGPPPERIASLEIDWRRFPPNFLKHPVHLQHDHGTGMTEGAVHSYCNAVLWQYEGR